MYTLILAIFWYHAPTVTAQHFSTIELCQAARTAALKEFTTDGWYGGASVGSKAVCVKNDDRPR